MTATEGRDSRRGRWTLSAVVMAVGLLLLIPRAAEAHARLVRSEPVSDARLSSLPTSINLWFNELLDDAFNSIAVFPVAEVSSEHRTDFVLGTATVDPADETHLTVPLTRMPPGEYIVEYRVLSRDGHSAPGRFTFHVVAAL